MDVLDKHLTDKRYMCGDAYTIADMAIYPWMEVTNPKPGAPHPTNPAPNLDPKQAKAPNLNPRPQTPTPSQAIGAFYTGPPRAVDFLDFDSHKVNLFFWHPPDDCVRL